MSNSVRMCISRMAPKLYTAFFFVLKVQTQGNCRSPLTRWYLRKFSESGIPPLISSGRWNRLEQKPCSSKKEGATSSKLDHNMIEFDSFEMGALTFGCGRSIDPFQRYPGEICTPGTCTPRFSVAVALYGKCMRGLLPATVHFFFWCVTGALKRSCFSWVYAMGSSNVHALRTQCIVFPGEVSRSSACLR